MKAGWLRKGLVARMFLGLALALMPGCEKAPKPASAPAVRSPQAVPTIPLVIFPEIELSLVAENLAHQAGINCVLDLSIPDKPVNIRWENITAEDALRRLAKENGLFLIENRTTTITRISPTNRIAAPIDERWVLADTSAEMPMFAFDHSNIVAALHQLAKNAEIRILIDPSISLPPTRKQDDAHAGTFTRSVWQQLKARQAIGGICENFDLVLLTDGDGRSARIVPLSDRK